MLERQAMNPLLKLRATLLATLAVLLVPGLAAGQEEIPPPSGGKAPLVVVLSGATGSGNYRFMAGRIAALGYDVALFDSNALVKSRQVEAVRAAVKEAIAGARRLPNALPGKVGVVGFSQGGELALGFASMWSDEVAVVAAWYPATRSIKDAAAFAGRLRVPVVMFAGTADEYKFCCMIDKARELAAAAKAANRPFELTAYPGVQHGFSIPGNGYNASVTDDALARTAAALKQYLGR
jgi:dienelactone hydrolase